MSAGLRRATATTDTATPASPWRTVLHRALAVFGVLHVVAAVAMTDLEAAGLVALLLLVVALRPRLPRTTTVALGVLLANSAAWIAPGTVRNLTGGAPLAVTLLQAAIGAAAVLGLVALVAQRRGVGGALAPRVAVAVAIAATVVTGVLAVVVGDGPTTPEPGDLEVVAVDTAFVPQRLEADAGEVAVHLTNEDFFWHTFSLPSLGVDLWVPVGGTGRVSFEVPAGTWAYTCAVPGHGLVMSGDLVVTP